MDRVGALIAAFVEHGLAIDEAAKRGGIGDAGFDLEKADRLDASGRLTEDCHVAGFHKTAAFVEDEPKRIAGGSGYKAPIWQARGLRIRCVPRPCTRLRHRKSLHLSSFAEGGSDGLFSMSERMNQNLSEG